jgi:hypothetical protein
MASPVKRSRRTADIATARVRVSTAQARMHIIWDTALGRACIGRGSTPLYRP